jgi:hypothetical protein
VQIVRVLLTIGISLVVLAVSLLLLRVREFTDVVSAVAARLTRLRAR